jgi:hypothetical protein
LRAKTQYWAFVPALHAATAVASTAQTVKFRDGTIVPAIGQGSAGLGQGRHPAAEEEEALRTDLSLGMTLIDTSGDYGEGRSEELIKRVIAGGACPTSQSAKWKTYSVFHKGIAARPIRFLTASGTAPLNVTYYRGASSMVCR